MVDFLCCRKEGKEKSPLLDEDEEERQLYSETSIPFIRVDEEGNETRYEKEPRDF
jgi:hypothetical protein